jgi:cytochrome c
MARILTALAAIALVSSATVTASDAIAAGNAAKGQSLSNRCTVCHSMTSGGGNRVGPNLFGVVGRKAGTFAGYSYSSAMKNSGLVWSEDNLAKYLMSPSTIVSGTKMSFGGFQQQQQASDVAAYLATLK